MLVIAAASLVCMAIFTWPGGSHRLEHRLRSDDRQHDNTLHRLLFDASLAQSLSGPSLGVASALIAFAMAFGPGVFGGLRDIYGSYGPALLLAGALNIVAAIIMVWGRSQPLPIPSWDLIAVGPKSLSAIGPGQTNRWAVETGAPVDAATVNAAPVAHFFFLF